MKENKQWKFAACLLLSTVAFVACEQDQADALKAIDDNEISITADIQETHTRMTGSEFASGDKIGVYVVEYASDDATRDELANGTYKNHEFTYTNNAWSGNKMYWQTLKQVDVIGYYPYTSHEIGVVNAYPLTIDKDQSTLEKLVKGDFLWAMKTTKPRSNAVPLNFEHKMSKIVINYKLGEGFPTFPQNMPIKVQTKGALTTTIDLKTGIVTPGTYGETYQEYKMYETVSPGADIVFKQQAIVVPQTMKGGDEFITMTVPDQGLFKYVLPQDIELKSGYEHTFEITLTKGGIQVSIGAITDWTRPDRPNSGNATAIVPPVTADIDNSVNDFWDRISATTTEEILIHYGTGTTEDPTRIYFKPEGQDKGYTLVFDKQGYPSKLVAGQAGDGQTLAIFVPELTATPPQLGVGLITTSRYDENNNILLNKVDMPAGFLDKTYPEKLDGIIGVLVDLVEKNNLTQQIPPAQFGQGSELLGNLIEELEQETEQPVYGGSGSAADTAINDSINSLLGAQSPGGNNGNPFTPEESVTHIDTNETSSTTGVDQAVEANREDIQMIESGVQGGFGDVKVTLTWNCEGDMDVWLKDPKATTDPSKTDNHVIYYGNKTGDPCGGSLDVDNQYGFMLGSTSTSYNRPENIFFKEGKGIKGTYYAKVVNYNYNSSVTPSGRGYTLYIYAFGKTKTYRGNLVGDKSKVYFKFNVIGQGNVEFSSTSITGQSW